MEKTANVVLEDGRFEATLRACSDSCDANWTWLFCGGEFFRVSNGYFSGQAQIKGIGVRGHAAGGSGAGIGVLNRGQVTKMDWESKR